MPFTRLFDEEVDRAAVQGCLNDGAIAGVESYCLALTAAASDLSDIAPGVYHVFLAGMSPAATVLLAVTRSGDALVAPVPGTPQLVTMFPGNVVARIRVLPGRKVVSARLLSGTGSLYLVPVVAL